MTGALAQVFHGLVLLTSADAREAGLSMTVDDLDVVLAMRSLQVWLDPESPVMRSFIVA